MCVHVCVRACVHVCVKGGERGKRKCVGEGVR